RTAADLGRLLGWLEARGVSLMVLEGNHDRSPLAGSRRGAAPFSAMPATCTVAGWTIGHGHRRLDGERTISGHLHPELRLDGRNFPCFLAGAGRIVLPAFSSNAAGGDVRTRPLPTSWGTAALDCHCLASTGEELLDLGPMSHLRRR